jgi:alpha-ketoglutarate-dependent taurine dioxygenase
MKCQVTQMTSPNQTSAPAWSAVSERNLGAVLSGVDLTAIASEDIGDLLRGHLEGHYVVVVKGQHLTESDHGRICESLGKMQSQERKTATGEPWSSVHLITNLDLHGKPSENPYIAETFLWHTDMSHKEAPVSYTLLYALELPPTGGETQFADMYAAYDDLPVGDQRRLSGMCVVHSRRRNYIASAQGQMNGSFPTVVHPLVRVHPDSKRKCLYIGLTAEQIVGMDAKESRELLDTLIGHSTQPKYVYSHKWSLGDLVIWDNRCLMHRAARDYEMARYRRTMRRSSVVGSTPAGVGSQDNDAIEAASKANV